MNEKQISNFWRKVDKEKSNVFYNGTRCWEWTRTTVKGYGRCWVGFGLMLAHRVSFELSHGEITDGLQVLHHCDNPPCVNPAHLFLGTTQDNMSDMTKKHRHADFRGEKHGKAILTAEQVIEIRQRYSAGKISQQKLGKEYGVSRSAIRHIVTNENWRHI
jgi:hypothetical protein